MGSTGFRLDVVGIGALNLDYISSASSGPQAGANDSLRRRITAIASTAAPLVPVGHRDVRRRAHGLRSARGGRPGLGGCGPRRLGLECDLRSGQGGDRSPARLRGRRRSDACPRHLEPPAARAARYRPHLRPAERTPGLRHLLLVRRRRRAHAAHRPGCQRRACGGHRPGIRAPGPLPRGDEGRPCHLTARRGDPEAAAGAAPIRKANQPEHPGQLRSRPCLGLRADGGGQGDPRAQRLPARQLGRVRRAGRHRRRPGGRSQGSPCAGALREP